jgi:hypothetical protein
VFPLVLYNGDTRWAAPMELAPLIGLPAGSPLWQWQPNMRYHVVDEGAYPDADLIRRDTLAGLLFRLENIKQPEQARQVGPALRDWFNRHPGFEGLKAPFADIVARMFEMTGDMPQDVRAVDDLLELGTMLANRPAQWKREWTEEGRQEGLQEGRREGAISMLTLMLESKFGALPQRARQTIASADLPLLQDWTRRAFAARSVDDLLG